MTGDNSIINVQESLASAVNHRFYSQYKSQTMVTDTDTFSNFLSGKIPYFSFAIYGQCLLTKDFRVA